MRTYRVLLALVLVVGVAACGGGGDDASPGGGDGGSGTSVVDDPQRGGSLTYLVNSEAPSLDPVKMVNFSAQVNDAIRGVALYDVLVWQDPNTGSLEMGTAESVTAEDPSTWVLKLRPGITFTDGTPYDAEAVKYNWERFKDPANNSPQLATAQTMETIEVVDPLTVRVTLTAPNGQFPRTIAGSFPMIASPAALEAEGENFTNRPVGAGPFKMTEWARDNFIHFERNPDYWNAPLPYLDEITMRVITDNDQRLRTLASGEADIMYSSSAVPLGQVDAGLVEGDLVTDTYASSFGRLLLLNNARPPFDDVRARKAVQLALDTEEYVAVANQGYGTPAHSFFVESSPFYDPALDLPRHDADAAQALFDELYAETGEPLRFEILHVPGVNRPQAEYLQAKFNSYDNVEVGIVGFQPTELTARLRSQDYTASFDSIALLNPEPLLWEKYGTGATRNFTHFSNAEADRLLKEGIGTLDDSVRERVYREFQEILLEQVPDLIIERHRIGTILSEDVGGFQVAQDAVPLFDRLWLRR